MKPILFDKNATQFDTNGIGRIDCTRCLVTEERNGQYELEMYVPRKSQYADQIEMNSIIVVRPSDEDTLQAFIVYQINDYISGDKEVFAYHISYRLNFIPAMPFSVSASTGACASVLAGLKSHAVHDCPFNFSTDVRTIASYQQKVPAAIRTMLGGTEGSVLDQYGGEYKWDNFNVYLYSHRGVQTPNVTLRYGKDVTDLSQEENIAKTITGIVPFWTDSEGGELVTLDEKVVESSHASSYPFKRTVSVDYSMDFETKPTQEQLRAHARAEVNKSGVGIPNVSIKLSFIDLAKTVDYERLLAFQSVKLCDEIGISFEELGIETTAQVVKTVYNVLEENYKSIEIGTVRTSVAKTINETDASITSLADATKTNFAKEGLKTDAKIEEAIDEVTANFPTRNEVQQNIDNATAWLTDSDGLMRAILNANGEWQSLVFMDENTTATTGNCMRLNKNGWGFSTTGWNGTFYQGVTLDGRALFGGTNFPSLTVYDNSNNVIFHADKTKVIWNAANSSMDASGTLSATSAQLTNASFNGGSISMHTNTNLALRISAGRIDFEPDTANESSIYPTANNGLEIESDALRLQTKTTGTGYKGIEMWQGSNNPFLIISNSSALQLKTGNGSNIEIESGKNVNISGDYISLESVSGIQVATKIQAYDPSAVLIGDDPEIRFYDGMDNYTDDITLDCDALIIEAKEIAVRTSRSSGSYKKGYTGSINGCKFVNGICIGT